jgi:hypothetical protein
LRRPRGSWTSSSPRMSRSRSRRRVYVPCFTSAPDPESNCGDVSSFRACETGTMVPSWTHSPSRSVSHTARSLLARASKRARSFWRLRWRSAAQFASRTCAMRSSRWV